MQGIFESWKRGSETDRPWSIACIRTVCPIRFICNSVSNATRGRNIKTMLDDGVAHVSRNDRDAESLWFLEGCRLEFDV